MWWKFVVPGWIFVGFSILLVALVSWTSDYGGLLVRPETPFSTRESKEVAIADEVPHVMHAQRSSGPSVEVLEGQLCRAVTVADVIPIFREHNCQKCHAKNFEDGKPKNFFVGKDSDHIFLARNPDGSLADITTSNFYHVVLVENAMPKGKYTTIPLGEVNIVMLAEERRPEWNSDYALGA